MYSTDSEEHEENIGAAAEDHGMDDYDCGCGLPVCRCGEIKALLDYENPVISGGDDNG